LLEELEIILMHGNRKVIEKKLWGLWMKRDL